MSFTKSVLRKTIKMLPAHLRQDLIRSRITLPKSLNPKFTFKLAETKDELEQSFKILHDCYVQEGYSKIEDSGLRITKYHLLPSTSILIIKCENQVIGTMSIVRNGKYGVPVAGAIELPSEETHRDFGEVSSLAIREDFRQQGGEFFLWMINYSLHYMIRQLSLKSIVIGVHPKWTDFYEGLLGFETLDSTYLSNYNFANGNPLTVLKLDLENFEKNIQALYKNKPEEKNFYSFYKKPLPSNIILPQREIFRSMDPSWTPQSMESLLIEKDKTIHRLDENEKLHLVSSYPLHLFDQAFKKANIVNEKRFGQTRYLVNFDGVHLDSGSALKILDVSASGFSVESEQELPDQIQTSIQFGPDKHTQLTLEKTRRINDKTSGFRVVHADSFFDSMIKELEDSFTDKTAS